MFNQIKLYEVTWYSKLGTGLFFIGVLPLLTFYMGTQYELALQSLSSPQSPWVIYSLQSTANMQLTGTYVGPHEAELTVSADRGDLLHISGQTYFPIYSESGTVDSANMGELDITVPVVRGTAHYSSSEYSVDGTPCEIDFEFKENNLRISTHNTMVCGWGAHVDFAGIYVKK